MGTVLARLNRVWAGYGHRDVLRGVSLSVTEGRRLAILGPSGAGKSTIVRLLSGEVTPRTGTIERDSTLRVAVVHQESWLYPWLTVAENVALGLTFRRNRVADASGVPALLRRVGIESVAASYPDEISGGQAQRAALARALAVEPELLLLDEPFSSLDPATRADLQHWLRQASVDSGLTTVFVTHDIDEALIVADEIVLVSVAGTIEHRWMNHRPAVDQAAAAVHPLRSEIRASYRDRIESDDEEFSGAWPGMESSVSVPEVLGV